MQEYAEVVKVIDEHTVEVQVRRHTMCDKCGKCGGGGGSHGRMVNDTRFEVANHVNARVGDRVLLEMEDKHFVGTVMLVYLVPLINVIIGYILGDWVNKSLHIWEGEGFAILSGLTLMALTFLFVRYIDRIKGDIVQPKIKRVVQ